MRQTLLPRGNALVHCGTAARAERTSLTLPDAAAGRTMPSAEAMIAPRAREQCHPPSPPDRLPPRRGGHPSSSSVFASGRLAGFARLAGARLGLVRSARVLAAVVWLSLLGALALPVAAQTSTDATLRSLVVNDGIADLTLGSAFHAPYDPDAGITIIDTNGAPLAGDPIRLTRREGARGRYGFKLNTRPTHAVWVAGIQSDGDRIKELGIAAVPHGFRSSFRDWAAERTSTPREVVEAALAHTVQNPTEAAYARSDLFERRRLLMNDWAAYLNGQPKSDYDPRLRSRQDFHVRHGAAGRVGGVGVSAR